MGKERFGIMSPISGIKKNVPIILTLTPDNSNVLLKDGKILRRKMREATLLGYVSLQLDNCETEWDYIKYLTTSSIDEEDYTEGAGSVKLVIPDGLEGEDFIEGIEIDEVDLSGYTSIKLKIKSSIETELGDLVFVLGTMFDVIEAIDIPALEADIWTEVELTLDDPSACTEITVIALQYVVDIGACTLHIDNIRAIGDEEGTKTQTPDGNPIIHYHRFVKRSTGTEYLLAFTKAHIYHWNLDDKTLDLKFTCASDCENWESVSYNDKVIATNNVDKVLVWDTTGDFVALDNEDNGIEYSRSYSSETAVDETSASGQKVLSVGATTGYTAGDKVIIGRGTDKEEECVVASVQAGISLTMVENLTYEHTADAKTTVDADSSSMQTILNVASTEGFAVDELVTINVNGDRAETRKIYTIQEGISLTFTVDLSYTHTQAQGDEVVGSNGDEDVVEEYTPYYLTKAKYLTVFENYLLLGNTYENSVNHYQRVRWCDIGDETNWISGSSGSMEVGQSDKITGFGHYQGFLIIFKDSSHFKVWLVGLPYVFNKVQLSTEIGCKCSGSIVNDSKGRLYFYSSEGTIKEIATGTISDDIQTDIVAKIQPAYVKLIKSAFINETEEVVWSIPVESNLNNTLVAFKEGKWLVIDSAVPAFGECSEG